MRDARTVGLGEVEDDLAHRAAERARKAQAAFVHSGAYRHPHARRLEPDTAAPAGRYADRTADVRAMGNRHDAGGHSRCGAPG
jgi:hypothetical protein